MVRIFDPNDFVVDATGFAGVVCVFVAADETPEISSAGFDEGFARRL